MPSEPSVPRSLVCRDEWLLDAVAAGALLFSLLCVGLALVPAAVFLRWLWQRPWGPARALGAPVAWLLWGVSFSSLCVLVRWVLLPRTLTGSFPIASARVVRWGVVHRLAHLAQQLFIGHFAGTPWVNLWFRALGARIGARVSVNTTDITDWDLVEIGDDVLVGYGASIQAHRAERGQMLFSGVKLGKGALVGRGAVVFDGVTFEPGAILAPSSSVPPGQRLEAGRTYCGVPARRAGTRDGCDARPSAWEEAS